MENLQQDCIFCQIIIGSVSARKVYEDDKCVAVLDINPANPGHVFLLPKFHAPLMPQLPEEHIEHLAFIAKGLSRSMLSGLGATGTTMFIANGVAAGQRAPHTMLHLIPRKENDGVGMALPEHKLPDDMKKQLLEGLRPVMSRVLGGETAPPSEETEPLKKPEPEEPEKPESKEPESKKGRTNLDAITELLTK